MDDQRLLVVPSLVFYGIAIIWPLLFETIPSSFYNWNLIKGTKIFNGFTNYVKLFRDKTFIHAIVFTVLLGIASILISNVAGFLIAYLLDSKIRWKGVTRSLFFIPNIISGVMVSFVWLFLFTGVIPSFAKMVHLNKIAEVSWFGDAKMAAIAVLLVTTWQEIGFLMMLYIAGLQTIPKDIIEAALLDGCTGIKKIFHIQLPLLMPTITINLFVSISGAFKAFDIPLSLTRGGPANSTQTIALNIYNDAFGAFKTGYASAKSMVLFLMVCVIAMIQLTLTRRREVQL